LRLSRESFCPLQGIQGISLESGRGLGSHHFNLQKDGRRGTASCHQALELCTCLEHSTPIAALLSKKFLPVMIEQATTLTPAPLPHDSRIFRRSRMFFGLCAGFRTAARSRYDGSADRGSTGRVSSEIYFPPVRPALSGRGGTRNSGNPKGRPKGSKNFSTLFAKELAQTVTLTENGKRKKMAKRQARAKQLVNKALSNDPKAAALVLDQIRRSEALGSPARQAAMNMTEQKFASIARQVAKEFL
jgi:Family of unknown function (DUF5681)